MQIEDKQNMVSTMVIFNLKKKKKHFIPHIYIYTYIRHKLVHHKFKGYHNQVDKCYSFYTSKLEPKIYNVNTISSY